MAQPREAPLPVASEWPMGARACESVALSTKRPADVEEEALGALELTLSVLAPCRVWLLPAWLWPKGLAAGEGPPAPLRLAGGDLAASGMPGGSRAAVALTGPPSPALCPPWEANAEPKPVRWLVWPLDCPKGAPGAPADACACEPGALPKPRLGACAAGAARGRLPAASSASADGERALLPAPPLPLPLPLLPPAGSAPPLCPAGPARPRCLTEAVTEEMAAARVAARRSRKVAPDASVGSPREAWLVGGCKACPAWGGGSSAAAEGAGFGDTAPA